MLESSLISILGISIPEEYIFILATAFLVGRRDVIDHKSINQILRIIATVFATVWFTNVLVHCIDNTLNKVLVQIVFFIVAYTVVLGLKWYEAAAGFLVYLVYFIFAEFTSIIIMTSIVGIQYIQVDQTTFLPLIYTIPARLLEMIFVVILFRNKKVVIDLSGIASLSKSLFRKMIDLQVNPLLVAVMVLVTSDMFVRTENRNPIVIVLFVLSFIGLVIQTIYNANKKSRIIQKEREKRVQQLLSIEDIIKCHNGNIDEIRKYIKEEIARESS